MAKDNETFRKDGVTNSFSANQLFLEYRQLFDGTLRCFHGGKIRLHTKPDATPRFFRARTLPFAIKQRVEDEIRRLVHDDILEPVQFSNWSTPIVPVLKKNNTVRICGDFKVTFNPESKVEHYPLPRIDELLATFGQKRFFSKLDMSNAYLQLELEEDSREFVTINTTLGLFRYKRLPFGITSAPAIFQRTIDSILKGISGVQIYLDDIIIASTSESEHLNQLHTVLSKLQSAGFRLRREKCSFFQTSVEYLGYHIDDRGLKPLEDEVKAIKAAPVPRNQGELRSYLGLLTFYSRFLKNLSTVVAPLNKLLGKVPWRWTTEENSAFQKSKDLLLHSDLLIHYNPSDMIFLQCDASAYGLGVVISHRVDGHDRPIAFASRSLTTAQKNYSQLEKEALSIIFGLRKFREYLFGNRFTIITDHQPLLGLLGPGKPFPEKAAARIQRWALELSSYDYSLEFRATTKHANCDALSRLPLPDHIKDGENEVHSLFFAEVSDTALTSTRVKVETGRDLLLSQVLTFISSGWPQNVPEDLKPYHLHKDELSVVQGCLLWGRRVVIPFSLRSRVLQELHETHMGIVRTKALARSFVWWPNIDKAIAQLCNSCTTCQMVRNDPPKYYHPWTFPVSRWSRLHIDFAGPVNGTTFLVCIDAHSKWPEVVRMSSTTSEETVRVLRSLFSRHGLPRQIVSDNGRQFVSDTFRRFLKDNGIKHITSAPYHPSTNGLAERFVQTLKKALKCFPGDLDHGLQNFLFCYRNTPHSTTGDSPAMLLLGRSLRSRLDLLRPDVPGTVLDKSKVVADHPQRFFDGSKVLAKNYQGDKWIHGVVLKLEGSRNAIVDVGHAIWRRSLDQLLPISESASNQYPDAISFSENQETNTTEVSPTSSPPVPVPRRNPPRFRQQPIRYPDND